MAQAVRSRGKKVDVLPEDREKIVRLHKQGQGYTKISQATGYSRWTVAVVLKEAGVDTRAPSSGNGRAAVQTVAEPKVVRPEPAARPEAKAPAPVKRPQERRAARRGEDRVPSASELSSLIMAAEQEAREYAKQITGYADELASMWERAEYLAQHEEALAQAIAAMRVLKERVDRYKRQIDEVQQRSLQQSMAIHSESKSLARE
jgi:hypothetical protein